MPTQRVHVRTSKYGKKFRAGGNFTPTQWGVRYPIGLERLYKGRDGQLYTVAGNVPTPMKPGFKKIRV